MQTDTIRGDGRYEPSPPAPQAPPGGVARSLALGAAVAAGAMGAVLALTGLDSPLRAPFTLFFLLMAPAGALAVALGRMDPLGRAVVAGAGALAVDLLVAQVMLALHLWSVRGGVFAVAAFSGVLLLGCALRRRTGRTRARRTG
ncbi:hypothetical protein HEK616_17960 [Streptomyces nigrescens]|uniref:Integral membrane protein n=2 Tax=Streptomyces TaxID=1883 RepID=A0ABM7ZPK0_STRNI|nr:hypothetical protein [Streptomyces nigrescens]MEE4422862.1 hypothetical protein [Streptomyces sp. DSM 41528]BDM68309.1 hypothetical protein HEK616_17960 [Streptomyces nigrescens]